MARASPKTVVERCWTLVGSRRGRIWLARRIWPISGETYEVRFDAGKVLAREEKRGDIVGFLHTHPAGMAGMSQRDVRTMRAWSASFGKPLLCLIEVDGQVHGWRFDNDRSAGEKLGEIELFPRGAVVIVE